MADKKIIGIRAVGTSLLVWSFMCSYISLINIVAIGRPFIQSAKHLFISTNLLIIIQSALHFIMNILFFINAIHILRLKSYAVKEFFILIITSGMVYILTNFLITHNLIQVLIDYKLTLLIWFIFIFYFTRPHVRIYFGNKKWIP